MNPIPELTPCPKLEAALNRLALEDDKGIFMWYVRKHAERCAHCRETVDALKCYYGAIHQAYEDSQGEGVTESDLHSLLKSLDASPA